MNRTVIATSIACLALAVAAAGAEPVVYPAKGQSAEQQERDQFECHQWATKDTGVDPVALAEQKLASAEDTEKQVPRPKRRVSRVGWARSKKAKVG